MNIIDLIEKSPNIWMVFIETNVFCMLILGIIFFTGRKSKKLRSRNISDKSFDRIVIGTIITMFFDSGMWIFNAQTFGGAKILNIIFSTFCYIMTPIVSFLAIDYIHNKVFVEKDEVRKANMIFLIPIIITTILAIVNIYTGWIFTVDSNNVYNRGSLFICYTIIPFIYLAYTSVLSLIYAKKQVYSPIKKDYQIIATFVIPAVIGGIIQTITSLSATWAGVTISIIILYITVQNSLLLTDSLTGIGNRRSYEIRLSEQIKYNESSGKLFAIMFDIDNFKHINDKYGHHIGDKVLVEIGHILGEICYTTKSFGFRYGGDEFAILGTSDDAKAVINKILEEMEILLTNYNNDLNENKPFLSISRGYAIYDKNIDKNAEAFMSRADKAMYNEKLKKNCK